MSAATLALIALCAFAAAYFALASSRDARLRRRITPHLPTDPSQAGQRRDPQTAFADLLVETERRFENTRIWSWIDRLRRQAGLTWSNAQLIWTVAGATTFVPLVLLVVGASGAVAILALPGTLITAFLFLQVKSRRRMNAFDQQLPEVLETLAAALKVGHSLQHSLQTVATETGEPAASEFAALLHELRLGRTLEEALGDLATRMSSRDFHFVVTSIAIQRQVGGSLSDLLQTVAQTVRRRQNFSRKIKALTAMGRISAQVLLALPFVVVLGLTAVNPTYMRPLVATSTGRTLIVISLAMLGFGAMILKRMTSVKA